MPSSKLVAIAAFLGGAVLASAAWSLAAPRKIAAVLPEPSAHGPEGEDALRRANENLTTSLQQCDRKLDELRSAATPAPSAARNEDAPDAGRGNRRTRGEPTQDDWERMAQLGSVRVRIPCVRDTPWTPTARAVERLGLAPTDSEAIKEAYAHSNQRVADVVRPLCAQVLGGSEVADKVGTSACMDAITNAARKGGADQAKDALVRTAEVQAGKRQPAPDASALEKLTTALAREGKSFENDLAQKLGPDEAKRIAWSNELCTDRRTFRASDAQPDEGSAQPR
ncbi:MAG TPA: hypothetical protein VIF62_31850 [Labilithrix sp.]